MVSIPLTFPLFAEQHSKMFGEARRCGILPPLTSETGGQVFAALASQWKYTRSEFLQKLVLSCECSKMTSAFDGNESLARGMERIR